MQTKTLKISELFKSIQGESIYAGLPCAFVRLFGCHLRCRWCDTEYSYYGQSQEYAITRIIDIVRAYQTPIVEITGGEPLLQENVYDLIEKLKGTGKKILLETSGACSLRRIDTAVHIIMDLKCPASGEADRNKIENLQYLKNTDEIKFVVADEDDYRWAKNMIAEHHLQTVCRLSMSPENDSLNPQKLADWMLRDNMNLRIGLQIHKYIWPEKSRAF